MRRRSRAFLLRSGVSARALVFQIERMDPIRAQMLRIFRGKR